MKKIVLLSLLTALALGTISTITVSHKNSFVLADNQCNHSGFHYYYVSPLPDTPGHKEFWTCCSCHSVFLGEPEKGSFVDQDEELMTGGIDKTHPAYIPQLRSLTYNGHKYFPVVNDNLSNTEVVFYDSNLNELSSPFGNYQLSELKDAEYFYFKENTFFTAISSIDYISFYDLYEYSEGSGPATLKNSFVENNLDQGESVESLTTELNLSITPFIGGKSLSEIWNTYKSSGFSPDTGLFWSCVKKDETMSYCYDCSRSMWFLEYAMMNFYTSVCITKLFSYNEI